VFSVVQINLGEVVQIMATIDTVSLPDEGGWHFDWLVPLLTNPRATMARITAVSESVWHAPIFVLIMTALGRVLLAGSIKQTAALSGQVILPPGFEYYTPEQQAQFQQAMAATSGPVFTYVLPAIVAVLGVLAAWFLVGWLLHLVLTMLGGRSGSGQVLNIVAWATLPYALRDLVRMGSMLNTEQLLSHPGLSGFAAEIGANWSAMWSAYLASLLGLVDIYLIWYLVLLVIGIRLANGVSRRRAWTAVLGVVIVITLIQATPALIAAQFSDLTVIRPFF
jgi:hypothetical protein